MCTNSFIYTVCRFADGTPSRRALRTTYSFKRYRLVGADIIRPRVELPIAHKFVHAYCLPLRGLRGHVPALQWVFRLFGGVGFFRRCFFCFVFQLCDEGQKRVD